MIYCKTLGEHFDTKHRRIIALFEAREKIMSIKKATIKYSEGIDLRFFDPTQKKAYCLKGLSDIGGLDKDFIYPVISNTNYFDSHEDVHLDGSMKRTVKAQNGKVHYAVNHELKIGQIIAYPKDVEILLKDIAWKDLGLDVDGTTQALLFKTNLQDYSNTDARNVIENKIPAQNSIRMQYIQIQMGIKERGDEWKQQNAIWDEHIEKVVNREVAEEAGVAWFVPELKIHKEGSMVVEGSNDMTPIIYNDEPAKSTSSTEAELAAKALQAKKKYFINISNF